jgi:hypothetical protein
MHRIRKGQFKLGKLRIKDKTVRFGMRSSLLDRRRVPGACLARPPTFAPQPQVLLFQTSSSPIRIQWTILLFFDVLEIATFEG